MNFTHSVIKTAAYTMTLADEHVKITSSATITLPATSTLLTGGKGKKTYYFEVSGAGVTLTIAPNSADTINGSSTSPTFSGDGTLVSLVSDSVLKNWEIASAQPILDTINLADGAVTGAKSSLGKHYGVMAAVTTGTTAVDLFSSAGAPAALTITSVTAVAQDTLAGNMILTNGTNAVATFAKSTTAGVVTGEDGALANTSVTAADTVTVESSTTNGNGMVIVSFTSA
jgi:hypothetical protein